MHVSMGFMVYNNHIKKVHQVRDERLRTSIADSVKYHKSYLGSEVPQQLIYTVPRVKPVKSRRVTEKSNFLFNKL